MGGGSRPVAKLPLGCGVGGLPCVAAGVFVVASPFGRETAKALWAYIARCNICPLRHRDYCRPGRQRNPGAKPSSQPWLGTTILLRIASNLPQLLNIATSPVLTMFPPSHLRPPSVQCAALSRPSPITCMLRPAANRNPATRSTLPTATCHPSHTHQPMLVHQPLQAPQNAIHKPFSTPLAPHHPAPPATRPAPSPRQASPSWHNTLSLCCCGNTVHRYFSALVYPCGDTSVPPPPTPVPSLSRPLPGITLSPKQVQRGTELAKEQGVSNVQFQVGSCRCAPTARAVGLRLIVLG